MKTPNWIYLDLEAQHPATDVGGWDHIDRMKCSVAVTFSLREHRLSIHTEDALPELAKKLKAADCVIGYNLLRFDLVILEGYESVDLTGIRCLDMVHEFRRAMGHGVPLDNLLQATFGMPPGIDGNTLMRWWRKGKTLAVAGECCNDVLAMRRLHAHALEHGTVRFRNKFEKLQTAPANWSTRRAVRWHGEHHAP
ncbi:MAG: helicase [Limisphaerales bacterium]